MKKVQHKGFYLAHDGDKEWLMKEIAEGNAFDFSHLLKGLRGDIFSNDTLQHFIDEEIRHDHFEIVAGKNNILTWSSSGEQRKALLSYIIAKKPDYLIIDNVFDSLDKDVRQTILKTLQELSSTTLFLQIFNRKNEVLPFIETIYSIRGKTVIDCQGPAEFLSHLGLERIDAFTGAIPGPITRYQLPVGPLVKMNNVSVQFNGNPVLQNICWEINAGEFWQLTGPNGSGKSTLLSLVTGNSPKGYGQDLVIFGFRKGTGETVWEIKEKMGYFTPSMTMQFERQDSIEQMVISGFFDSVGLYVKPTDRQVDLARKWLSVIGMYDDRNRPFRMFPPGQQRLILIARAMVKHPPLLILDEPTSGLDDEMAFLFTALINKIASETSSAILYISHKDEQGLSPVKIFELIPTSDGSFGKIIK